MPASRGTIRVWVAAGLLACLCLWGIEKLAIQNEHALTLNPHEATEITLGHPHLLWGLPPGETEVNGQRVLINAHGMRGAEVETPKATATRRILSLGGSMAFGEGVARRDTYTADAVRDLGGERVGLEALIMAVPQYTALQTRNLMDMRGWSLDPDLILIAGPGAELDVSAYEDEVVTSVYRGLTDTHREMESLAIFRILDHWVRVKNGPKPQARDLVFGQQQGINPNQRPRLGTNAYARHLDAIVQTAREREVEIVFIIAPLPTDLDETQAAPTPALYRDAMHHVAARHGVKVVDGPAVFRASARNTAALFQDDGKLSVQGHRTLSYALSRTLKPWMRGRPLKAKATGEPLAQLTEPGDAP